MSEIVVRNSEVALLLAALRDESDDPEMDRFARSSLLSAIAYDELLMSAAIAEIGPEQAELDIHFDGPTIEGHSGKAEPFGIFVTRTAQAVKEMAKTKLGLGSYSSKLLISATTPGSLRVVLKAPSTPDKGHTVLERSDSSNVESDSLRTLAILLSQAGGIDPGPDSEHDDGPMVATIQQLPPAARERVKSAVAEVARAGWKIDGELRQKGVGIVRIHVPHDRVTRLQDQLAQTSSSVEKDVSVVGAIDGTRRFTGSMWFQPEKSDKPFVASVTDAKLLEKVNEINALADARVRATFERYSVSRTGGEKARSRVTYLLTAIEVIPTQPALL